VAMNETNMEIVDEAIRDQQRTGGKKAYDNDKVRTCFKKSIKTMGTSFIPAETESRSTFISWIPARARCRGLGRNDVKNVQRILRDTTARTGQCPQKSTK
ncbi:MAG TPA: hypothetical protein VFM35_09935, partial [Candidatus Binatia bacterium]|nr:hypothetical protein [Candidatus Binatia bacterium]